MIEMFLSPSVTMSLLGYPGQAVANRLEKANVIIKVCHRLPLMQIVTPEFLGIKPSKGLLLFSKGDKTSILKGFRGEREKSLHHVKECETDKVTRLRPSPESHPALVVGAVNVD